MSVIRAKRVNYVTFINIFFVIFCLLLFVLPFLLVIAISFTDESALAEGYKLIPEKFSLEGYKVIFRNPTRLFNAYTVTTLQSFLGTFIGVLVMALCAYPLSRKSFKWRKPITFYVFFTMLFGGGLIPSYLLNTQYLNLRNNFWIYILPFMANAFYLIILRTFFQGISISLVEAAKIDGASELRTFFQIILPLSKPVLATISLLYLLDRWNDWFTSLVYITDDRLFSLQYLMQKVLRELEFIKQVASEGYNVVELDNFKPPSESMRFGMCIVAAGPMLLIFPFFQKYFVKGLTVGSIKG